MIQALQEQYPEHRIILKTGMPATEPDASVPSWLGEPTRRAFYHRIDTSDPAQLTQSSSFRRGVKKAQKADVTVEVGTDEATLRTFYHCTISYALINLRVFLNLMNSSSTFIGSSSPLDRASSCKLDGDNK